MQLTELQLDEDDDIDEPNPVIRLQILLNRLRHRLSREVVEIVITNVGLSMATPVVVEIEVDQEIVSAAFEPPHDRVSTGEHLSKGIISAEIPNIFPDFRAKLVVTLQKPSPSVGMRSVVRSGGPRATAPDAQFTDTDAEELLGGILRSRDAVQSFSRIDVSCGACTGKAQAVDDRS